MTPLEASKKKNESTVYFNLYGDMEQFKVDRLQIIVPVVAKKYIYVSQLFISRMPKMRAPNCRTF